MNWYVVEDDEGFWITQTPVTSEIVHGPVSQAEAERLLTLEIGRGSEHELPNGDQRLRLRGHHRG